MLGTLAMEVPFSFKGQHMQGISTSSLRRCCMSPVLN